MSDKIHGKLTSVNALLSGTDLITRHSHSARVDFHADGRQVVTISTEEDMIKMDASTLLEFLCEAGVTVVVEEPELEGDNCDC